MNEITHSKLIEILLKIKQITFYSSWIKILKCTIAQTLKINEDKYY